MSLDLVEDALLADHPQVVAVAEHVVDRSQFSWPVTALSILFCLKPGTMGMILKTRRQHAAELLGILPDTLRRERHYGLLMRLQSSPAATLPAEAQQCPPARHTVRIRPSDRRVPRTGRVNAMEAVGQVARRSRPAPLAIQGKLSSASPVCMPETWRIFNYRSDRITPLDVDIHSHTKHDFAPRC